MGLLDSLVGRLRGERRLRETHRAPFQEPHWAPGRVVEVDGSLYEVTRWVELRPIVLERGGRTRRWEIWGKSAPADAVRREVVGAAERILAETDSGSGEETPVKDR